MKAYGNCSKNYIDCRKHPTRTGTATERVNEDYAAYRVTVAGKLAEAETALKTAVSEPKITKAKMTRLQNVVDEQKAEQVSVFPPVKFDKYVKDEEARIEKLPGKALSETRALNKVKALRVQNMDNIKENVEKEMKLQTAEPLEGFKLAVAKLLIQDGSAHDDESGGWGSSLGRSNYGAEKHMKDDCEPAAISDYEDNYTWNDYDTFSSRDSIGTRARISCKCGQVYKQNFIIDNSDVGSMFARLMNM